MYMTEHSSKSITKSCCHLREADGALRTVNRFNFCAIGNSHSPFIAMHCPGNHHRCNERLVSPFVAILWPIYDHNGRVPLRCATCSRVVEKNCQLATTVDVQAYSLGTSKEASWRAKHRRAVFPNVCAEALLLSTSLSRWQNQG
jgi:hypothetical protein